MSVKRWAIEWHTGKGRFENRSFMWNGEIPYLFTSRAACRCYIDEKYGYIRERPDLRKEPHFWRMPQPVHVEVILRPVVKP